MSVDQMCVFSKELVVLYEVTQVIETLRDEPVRVINSFLLMRKKFLFSLKKKWGRGETKRNDIKKVAGDDRQQLSYLSLLVRESFVELDEPRLSEVIDDEEATYHPSNFTALSISLFLSLRALLSLSARSSLSLLSSLLFSFFFFFCFWKKKKKRYFQMETLCGDRDVYGDRAKHGGGKEKKRKKKREERREERQR